MVLTNSDHEKTLTLADSTRDDLSGLDWDVFPYMYKPDWFEYEKDMDAGTLKLKLVAAPKASDNKQLTLIIVSNSNSHGIKARSFGLFNAQQKLTWREGDDKEVTQKTKWCTRDIRYVVVNFKEGRAMKWSVDTTKHVGYCAHAD